MSDPIFLRNMMSSSVYAEQINSAQVQGQQAARDRASRVVQEAIKENQAAVQRTEESNQIGAREDDERREQSADEQRDGEEPLEQPTLETYGKEAETHVASPHRVDLTV